MGFCSPKQEDSVCVNMLRSIAIAMHECAQRVYLGSVFVDMFEYQLEVGVLEVALEDEEDGDCEPGIRYVLRQCCRCWCVYL